MEPYDLDENIIINWAVNYSSYQELEKVSKSLYGIYIKRRKVDYPKLHRKNKNLKRFYKK